MFECIPICFIFIYTHKNKSSTQITPHISFYYKFQRMQPYEKYGKAVSGFIFKLHQISIYLIVVFIKTYTIPASVTVRLEKG